MRYVENPAYRERARLRSWSGPCGGRRTLGSHESEDAPRVLQIPAEQLAFQDQVVVARARLGLTDRRRASVLLGWQVRAALVSFRDEMTTCGSAEDCVGAGAEQQLPVVGVAERDLVIAWTVDDHLGRAETVLSGHLCHDRDRLVPPGVREVPW